MLKNNVSIKAKFTTSKKLSVVLFVETNAMLRCVRADRDY